MSRMRAVLPHPMPEQKSQREYQRARCQVNIGSGILIDRAVIIRCIRRRSSEAVAGLLTRTANAAGDVARAEAAGACMTGKSYCRERN